jgi:DNA-binding NtrC family response regulator
MKNKLILVIDDDQNLRESIVEILSENGFEAVGCETAEMALRKIKIRRPSIVIVDNIMPGMGGMALIPYPDAEKAGV